MESLSLEEEMQVNQSIAKEFIENHLSIPATFEHVDALAHFIFQLEHRAGIENPHLGHKKNSTDGVFYINQKESTHDKTNQENR